MIIVVDVSNFVAMSDIKNSIHKYKTIYSIKKRFSKIIYKQLIINEIYIKKNLTNNLIKS